MSIFADSACNGQTLVDRVKFWSEKDPDHPAFIFWSSRGRQVVTRKDVLDLSSKFASRLDQHSVQTGDVVCISLPNCPQRVVAEFGVHLVGAITLNGQVLRSDGEDLISSLQKSECSSMILNPEEPNGAWSLVKSVFNDVKVYPGHFEVQSERIPSLKTVFTTGQSGSDNDLIKSIQNEPKISSFYKGSPQDRCAIFTTSGSTGYSKLVPHSHEAVLMYFCHFFTAVNDFTSFNFFDSSPFGWIGGFPAFYLFSGCTQVAMDDSCGNIENKPAFIWDILCKEDVKSALLVPGLMEAVLDVKHHDKERGNDHKMRRLVTGGQPIMKDHLSVIGDLTESVAVVYGLTEAGILTWISVDASNLVDFKDDEAGFVLPGVSLKIVDKHLNAVPPNCRGEILAKTPVLNDGYINADKSANESFLPDGWFRTGDIGYQTQDGCLFVEGRSSEAIMHGAYILYPTWLEQLLIKCPGVKDVVIVPVPDKILHHEICACVHVDEEADVTPSADDIINFCQKETVLDKSSSLNVIPKYVLFFDEFPRTNTDKLNRRGLATIVKERLNL